MYGNFTYSDAKAGMKNLFLSMPAFADTVMENLYDVEAVSEIVNYSDLHFKQYAFTVGGTYDFNTNFYVSGEAGVDIFEDDEEYVYGDQDGKAYRANLGVGYRF